MAIHRKENKKGKLWVGQTWLGPWLDFCATNRIYVEIKLFQNFHIKAFPKFFPQQITLTLSLIQYGNMLKETLERHLFLKGDINILINEGIKKFNTSEILQSSI